jgi:hypothetical protein
MLSLLTKKHVRSAGTAVWLPDGHGNLTDFVATLIFDLRFPAVSGLVDPCLSSTYRWYCISFLRPCLVHDNGKRFLAPSPLAPSFFFIFLFFSSAHWVLLLFHAQLHTLTRCLTAAISAKIMVRVVFGRPPPPSFASILSDGLRHQSVNAASPTTTSSTLPSATVGSFPPTSASPSIATPPTQKTVAGPSCPKATRPTRSPSAT